MKLITILLFGTCLIIEGAAYCADNQIEDEEIIWDLESRKNHPCGDPFTVNEVFALNSALVESVVDCSTLRVTFTETSIGEQLPAPVTQIVRLAGIKTKDAGTNTISCLEFMQTNILGKKVELLSHEWFVIGKDNSSVILKLPQMNQSINKLLIRKGLASFAISEPYELTWWTECDYKMAQTEAQKNKLGIWSDQADVYSRLPEEERTEFIATLEQVISLEKRGAWSDLYGWFDKDGPLNNYKIDSVEAFVQKYQNTQLIEFVPTGVYWVPPIESWAIDGCAKFDNSHPVVKQYGEGIVSGFHARRTAEGWRFSGPPAIAVFHEGAKGCNINP